MSEKIRAIDLTEELFTALKDYFVAKVECGVTEIFVTFVNGQKFKITVEEN